MRNLALMWVLAGLAVALLAAGDGKPSVSTFTDKRDGKVYKIVKIGGQYWFAENLNYAVEGSVCYGEDGEIWIGFNTNKSIDVKILSAAEVQANCVQYGRLYDWKTAFTACPAGTHLPSDEEWTTLVDYTGGKEKAGEKLKSTVGWNNNGNGTNEYLFSALPGGLGDRDGYFYIAGKSGNWWSATGKDVYYAWNRYMNYENDNVNRGYNFRTHRCSVRCVLDDEKERRK